MTAVDYGNNCGCCGAYVRSLENRLFKAREERAHAVEALKDLRRRYAELQTAVDSALHRAEPQS